MARASAIVTDIEGTTTRISFVKDVLFRHANDQIPRYLREHRSDPRVVAILEDVREHEHDPSLDEDAIVALFCRWIDEDRKVTPLKAIQGYVWAEGYRAGLFHGHVYEDAAAHLRQWHARGIGLYVFSSGSVVAQRDLFAHTVHGDLSRLFSGFFDTTTGPKRKPSSYASIAAAIGIAPSAITFLSDTAEELDAAREAGMTSICLDRGEGAIDAKGHPCARDFGEVDSLLAGPSSAHH